MLETKLEDIKTVLTAFCKVESTLKRQGAGYIHFTLKEP